MTSLDPHIFRAYDIRGKAGTQLTEEACFLIGRAFGEVLVEKYGKENPHPTVAVGRDARTHSPLLQGKVIEGLIAAGCDIKQIGQTPSPVNYFTICNAHLDAGVQITASHNPKQDNGIKLQLRDAEAFSGEDLQLLRKRIESGKWIHLRQGFGGQEVESRKSNLQEFDAVTMYVEELATMFAGVGAGKHVVVDSGNGVAGPVYCEVLRGAGCKVTEMYTEPDGEFPNHPADPSKHDTLKELQAQVLELKADCGFGFDGDGDRMGLVDEKGRIVTADQTLLLLAQDHLKRHAGAPVIFTVSNSSLLDTEVKKWGGKPVMCKVGHSFVEHAMREHGALLGGEQSGHFFCGEDYFGFDDALVASLRILKILSVPQPGTAAAQSNDRAAPLRGRGSLSDLIGAFPKVFQAPERRPFCPDNKKADVVWQATQFFQKKYPVITLDGARIDFGEGAWAGVRYSNTSPCLSICIEARSKEKLSAVEGEVLDHLRTYKDVDWKR